ncbi:MAG: hypothetical protein Q8Q17_02750 [bacterium]|nr:hypothetical protein [bacterium]
MQTKKLTIDEFLSKINALKEKVGVDLSTAEDLSMAVMNLISLEEHFFFTGVKTKKGEYFDTSLEIREMRKKLLEQLMPNHEGETWCISKHLLAATMRLIEVGNKLHSEGKKEKAKQTFENAYKVYSIFWALKLKLIKGQKIKEAAKGGSTKLPSTHLGTGTAGSSTLEDLVSKLADCCDE